VWGCSNVQQLPLLQGRGCRGFGRAGNIRLPCQQPPGTTARQQELRDVHGLCQGTYTVYTIHSVYSVGYTLLHNSKGCIFLDYVYSVYTQLPDNKNCLTCMDSVERVYTKLLNSQTCGLCMDDIQVHDIHPTLSETSALSDRYLIKMCVAVGPLQQL
jgi:hypothetical protein